MVQKRGRIDPPSGTDSLKRSRDGNCSVNKRAGPRPPDAAADQYPGQKIPGSTTQLLAGGAIRDETVAHADASGRAMTAGERRTRPGPGPSPDPPWRAQTPRPRQYPGHAAPDQDPPFPKEAEAGTVGRGGEVKTGDALRREVTLKSLFEERTKRKVKVRGNLAPASITVLWIIWVS